MASDTADACRGFQRSSSWPPDVRELFGEAADLIERLERERTAQLLKAEAERDNERQRAEALAWDIQAYRGALGYPVAGFHTGILKDGTVPVCGICAANIQRAEAAERERDTEKVRADIYGAAVADWRPIVEQSREAEQRAARLWQRGNPPIPTPAGQQERYLVTRNDGAVVVAYWTSGGMWTDGWCGIPSVIAWMPFPEPAALSEGKGGKG